MEMSVCASVLDRIGGTGSEVALAGAAGGFIKVFFGWPELLVLVLLEAGAGAGVDSGPRALPLVFGVAPPIGPRKSG